MRCSGREVGACRDPSASFRAIRTLRAIAPAPLADPADFAAPPAEPMLAAQAQVAAADHIVIVFPLWLGTMPAALKAFFEQLARAEFALADAGGRGPRRNLRGRSARIIVTMECQPPHIG